MSWHALFKRAEDEGLPTQPFLGDTIEKAAGTIADVRHRMIMTPNDLVKRISPDLQGIANLRSEYDCQNLFWTVVRAWIPNLAREPFTIQYDGQKKRADFSLFGGKLVVEFKFVDSDVKKAEVAKTMKGLADFYKQNANIKILLMMIYVKNGTRLDAKKWEADFTYKAADPKVFTHIVFVP